MNLVEVIVVSSIVSLMIALLLTAVQRVRSAAVTTSCRNNLHQISLASQQFLSINGHFPSGVAYPTNQYKSPFAPRDVAGQSWTQKLLPYLEHSAISEKYEALYQQDLHHDRLDEHQILATYPIKAYRCPSDPRSEGLILDGQSTTRWSLLNYLGSTGPDFITGILCKNLLLKPTDVLDGSSQTIAFGERPTQADGLLSWWYYIDRKLVASGALLMTVQYDYANSYLPHVYCPPPAIGVFQRGKYNDLCSMFHYWSLHPGGANFAFADGSVRFLSYSAEPILPALATRAGGEVVGLD
jgi:prepilin-type processing-associated H-X9-DG protein